MANYHFNFAIVWRYAGKLFEGLLLSLELAAASIAIGMAIGLVLALPWTVLAIQALCLAGAAAFVLTRPDG